MRDLDRRIKRIEEEVNIDGPDEAAQEEAFRQAFPVGSKIMDEFHEKHQKNPDFIKERAEGRFSDKTINQFADYYFERLPELVKDPKFASMFKKGIGCGSTPLTTSGFDGRQEDQPN